MENNNNQNNNQNNNTDGNNNNNQNQNNNQNNSQQNQNTNQQQNNQQQNNSMSKEQVISEYVKSLGLGEGESLGDIVKKHNEDVQKNKTDLEKLQDEKREAIKNYLSEKERADIADAKLLAYTMGVKKELLDDIVVIVKSKLTEGKTVSDIITEIKQSERGKVYFETEEEEGNKPSNNTQTRGTFSGQNNRGNNNQNKNNNQNNNNQKHSGSIAERLIANRKQNTKKTFFSN